MPALGASTWVASPRLNLPHTLACLAYTNKADKRTQRKSCLCRWWDHPQRAPNWDDGRALERAQPAQPLRGRRPQPLDWRHVRDLHPPRDPSPAPLKCPEIRIWPACRSRTRSSAQRRAMRPKQPFSWLRRSADTRCQSHGAPIRGAATSGKNHWALMVNPTPWQNLLS